MTSTGKGPQIPGADAGSESGAVEDGRFLTEQEFRAAIRALPLVSIDLLVFNPSGDKVLLGLRRNPPAQGTWFVPGGRIRKGERMAQALRRICRAELGIDRELSAVALVGIFEHFYPDNFVGESASTHYVVHAYQLVLDEMIGHLPLQQHQQLVWWPLAEVVGNDRVHHYTQAYFFGPRTDRSGWV